MFDKKWYPLYAGILGVILLIAGVYLFYNPLDDNFDGFSIYRGETAKRTYVIVPPSPTFNVTMVDSKAVFQDKKLMGENTFAVEMRDTFFTFQPYDHSRIIIQIFEGGGKEPAQIISNVVRVRSVMLHEKCKYGVEKCSFPGLYVFTDTGETFFQPMTGKQYIVLTTKQQY